jgi:uncharacterized repeat protein (TIGR03803 family)
VPSHCVPWLVSLSPRRPARAWTETTLYSFCSQGGGYCTDGLEPQRNKLVFDSAGNIYGTASSGGANGAGDVFKLAPDGNLTVLLSFPDPFGGGAPIGGVVIDDANYLYGTAQSHIFKLAPDGTVTLVHQFTGENGDGSQLFAGLLRDKKGNLYGTTFAGGTYGFGTLFKIGPNGKEHILHSFAGPEGANPQAAPIMDVAGSLYGTTVNGGSNNCGGYGCGTVYKLAKDGTFIVLYAFTGGRVKDSRSIEPEISMAQQCGAEKTTAAGPCSR